MSNEWELVALDDPERCQAVNNKGGAQNGEQNTGCLFKRVLPSNYCPRHGGNSALQAQKKEQQRNYNLTKWRGRVNALADNPNIKSLREEIGIVRMMIETILERCKDESDLIMYSGKIQQMIMQAQKLVVDCHKLEERTGVLLDRQSILVFCDSAIKIIATHVEDTDALESISLQLVDVVAKMGGLSNVNANAPINAGAN